MMRCMKKSVTSVLVVVMLVMLAITLFLTGCAPEEEPKPACQRPYMADMDGCCLDRNANSVCDKDEEEDIFFVKPSYQDAPVQDVPDMTEEQPEQPEPEFQEPAYEEPEQPKDTEAPEHEEKPKTAYTASEPELLGWKAENDLMSIEVTKITIEVKDITPRDRTSPDKEAYLKEMHLRIRNKDYNYLNMELKFRLMDWKDPLIIKDTLNCDKGDDIPMEGCVHALPEGETMDITMRIDKKIPRLDIEKTIRLTLENDRDSHDENILEIEKTEDILNMMGADYT